MNKDYIYMDGKVIISDENGHKEPIEYYDNLDKVLVQENLIESIQNEINKLKKKSTEYKKINKGHYIPIWIPTLLIFLTIICPAFFNYISGGEAFNTLIETNVGTFNVGALIIAVIGCISTPIFTLLESYLYKQYKDAKKEEKGINSELEFLEKQLEKEKEHLENLKREKTKNNEDNNFRTVKVDDLQELKMLRNYLELYFDLGYNGEKYYQYYEQGKLDKKLEKNYDDEAIELAKEYLEEKGPVLFKGKSSKK